MKNLFTSKTIWLAAVQFLIGGLMAMQASHPSLGWVIMGKSILDILLRFITQEPVSLTGH